VPNPGPGAVLALLLRRLDFPQCVHLPFFICFVFLTTDF
jgi:hypothetical protein